MTRTLNLAGLMGDPKQRPRRTTAPAEMVRTVRDQIFARDDEFHRWAKPRPAGSNGLLNYLFLCPDDLTLPQEVFERLRWGGQCIFVSPHGREVAEVAERYSDRRGFVIEHQPACVHRRFLGLRLPGLSKPIHYFVARKVELVQPGQMTDRFTYDVRLVRTSKADGSYAVLKQIPEFDQVVSRLQDRLPETPIEVILKGARKLVDKVFPVFLTREAAFLSLLKRDLPAPYNERVPRVLAIQKDKQGFVRKLQLEWLRNGCEPLTQLQFARQSAELLKVLHDTVGIMHLDLRLDNFVITPKGVGFVDFGSAVRVGEDLSQNPMLRTLFSEMMTTSQIQRDLGKLVRKGKVTSRMLVDSHQKVDKAVDLFYLALQMNEPHSNPDFADLILYDPQSEEARSLAKLTQDILKPENPDNPPYKSAGDIVAALEQIDAGIVKEELVDQLA